MSKQSGWTVKITADHYKIRQQDGSFQQMTASDTFENRLFVSWVQTHD